MSKLKRSAVATALFWSANAAHGQLPLTRIRLETDFAETIVSGMNDSGVVVGFESSNGGGAARVWTPGPSGYASQSIHQVSGGFGFTGPREVNNAGLIAGTIQMGFAFRNGVVWPPAAGGYGAGQLLPNLPTHEQSEANALSGSGVVVGTSFTGAPNFNQFLATVWQGTPGAYTATALPLPPGKARSAALAINDSGVIGGSALTTVGPDSPVLWKPGRSGYQAEPLPMRPGDNSAFVFGVNNAGVAVGGSDHGALAWRPQGDGYVITPLAAPAGLTNAIAHKVNESGLAVGYASDANFSQSHAVLWLADGTAIDLDAALDALNPTVGVNWDLRYAYGINELNQVVGTGQFDLDGPGGFMQPFGQGFVLDVRGLIPEPSCSIGLIGFVALRRHRTRAA